MGKVLLVSLCMLLLWHVVTVGPTQSKSLKCIIDKFSDMTWQQQELQCCTYSSDDKEWAIDWSNSIKMDKACACGELIEHDSVANYWSAHYCSARKSMRKAWPVLAIVCWLPWMVFLFFVLASTADLFLVPTLQHISDLLKLSPSVAGATLLALVCCI